MFSKYKLEIAGIGAGATVGWCYWYFVGCASGSCPISSSPYISTIYGAVMGILAFRIFKKEPNKTTN
jgi:hypothetical protein